MSKVYTNNKKEAPFMGASFMHEIVIHLNGEIDPGRNAYQEDDCLFPDRKMELLVILRYY